MTEATTYHDPDELPQVSEADFRALMARAHELGVHYTGEQALELEMLLAMAEKEQGPEHPVPCFGLSYDPSARPCRMCSLRNACADLDKSPRVEVADVRRLLPVPCEVCRKGELSAELLDPESRELRDYGCTTTGCQNTISIQCGWEAGMRVEMQFGEVEEEEQPEAQGSGQESGIAGGDSADPAEATASSPADSGTTGAVAEEPAAEASASAAETDDAAGPGAASGPPSQTSSPKKKKAPKVNVQRSKKKTRATKTGAMRFRLNDREFTSLTAVATEITGSRNWSGPKFFKVRAADVKRGMTLSREHEGTTYVVEVVEGDSQ